ncbi:MAG: penicillin-binding protein 1C [Verrucomicrobiota bacterium]
MKITGMLQKRRRSFLKAFLAVSKPVFQKITAFCHQGGWERLLEKAFYVGGTLLALCAGAWWFLPKPPLLDGISFSQEVFDRNHKLLRLTLTADGKYRVYTPLEKIPQDLVHATLVQEDRFYLNHFGVNPVAAARSALSVIVSGHAHAGASTITMQLARLRFHLHTRTLRGKLAQMVRAVEFERHYTKAQILEAYFNLAPYGGNVEGVGAASEIYFAKDAVEVTMPEAVALSVIPQSPARRALRRGSGNEALTAAQSRLYDRLAADSPEKDFRARVETGRPFEAPQFTTQVLVENPGCGEITTTLDLDLQRLLEKRITGYMASSRKLGVKNAAVMLIDSSTMEVLAEAGSANFYDESINGQVDGTRCKRSPGSTLKPFVYALAMDQGLIHPLSILKDAPESFGSYNPENYDREFIGPIRAGEALARSRNIPAVELSSRLSHPALYEFLKKTGVRLPHDERFYGLTLPLGGAEVTLQELVRLYAVLANNGQWRSLHNTLPHSGDAGVRMLSPEAAFLILEMLGQIPRPSATDVEKERPVYWKTGTSNGFRDAWSVGIFDHFVLAVWVGNFDGSSNPAFIGRSCAGPLLFQVVDAMRAAGHVHPAAHEPQPFANLKRVEFCAVSGELATPDCKHRVSGWFIPGVSPITSCDVHREVLVDSETGLRVSSDDGTRTLRREVFEFWPSDLLELFEKAGLPRQLPPPFMPGSDIDRSARRGHAPVIVSPRSGVVYTVCAREDAGRCLSLSAQADADARRIYWFVDKELVGQAPVSGSLSWKPAAGCHTIVALDDSGRSTSCVIRVQSL